MALEKVFNATITISTGVSEMSSKEKEKLKLLFALIKGARRSDRELARAMKISQPTVTRKRTLLEKEGYLTEYTVIPDFSKVGYEIMAFTLLSFTESRPELFEKAREWTKKQPCVIFAASGEGPGIDSIMLSTHKNYASVSRLITQLRRDWQPNLKTVESFMISLKRPEQIIKQFSFRYLEANE